MSRMILSSLKSSINLINIWPAVSNHYDEILEDSPTAGLDLFILLGIPAIVSITAIFYPASTGFTQISITSLSILFGFTFNAVILLSGTDYSDKETKEQDAIEMTKGNTLYALVVGFATIVVSFLTFLASEPIPSTQNVILIASSILLYFLLSHYIMTLLLILRRLYILIGGDIIERR